MQEEALVLPLIGIVGTATALLFGAVILRLACIACNVDEPRFWDALVVVTLTAAVAVAAGFLAAKGLTPVASSFPGEGGRLVVPAGVPMLVLPLHMLLCATVYRRTLSIPLKRGFRIWLTQTGMVLGFVVVLALVYGAAMGLAGMLQEGGEVATPRSDPDPRW